jgi:hypothetical protein
MISSEQEVMTIERNMDKEEIRGIEEGGDKRGCPREVGTSWTVF